MNTLGFITVSKSYNFTIIVLTMVAVLGPLLLYFKTKRKSSHLSILEMQNVKFGISKKTKY